LFARGVGADNRLTHYDGFKYTYDDEGNRSRRYQDNNSNNVYDGGDTVVTAFYWDHRNRLIIVADYDQFAGTAQQAVTFTYDAHDRLIKRLVDPDGNTGSDPNEQTFYLWEMGQVALQFDRTTTSAVDGSHLSHRYLWGPAVDQLMADEQISSLTNASLNETLWALTDHLGSVRDVVDNAGSVRVHKDFDAFGNVQSETHYNASSSTVTSGQAGYVELAFGYTGKLFEAWTGLQYNNARWYDAKVGRWINHDPIGFAGGTDNLYEYVGNAPTMFTDPTGLFWGDYWYYLTHPWEMDGDLQVANGVAYGMIGMGTGGLAGIGAGAAAGAGVVAIDGSSGAAGIAGGLAGGVVGRAVGEAVGGFGGGDLGANIGGIGGGLIGGIGGGAAAARLCPATVGPMQGPSPAINLGRQGKHIVGHNNYQVGKSILRANPEELGRFAGTGRSLRPGISIGKPGSREVVDFGRTIGDHLDELTGAATPSRWGIITYGKDGIHIFPVRPQVPGL
jgi:RHS repeat-associated protein